MKTNHRREQSGKNRSQKQKQFAQTFASEYHGYSGSNRYGNTNQNNDMRNQGRNQDNSWNNDDLFD